MEEKSEKTIYLAGGCFWGLEKYLAEVPGVLTTEVGYANGRTAFPTYEEVCKANTGHAEAVKVVYDSGVVSLEMLLSLYYMVIDPTSVNRQGNDVGSQYRTGIYYVDPADKAVVCQSVEALQGQYQKPLAIEVLPLENYYVAEDYHQKYLDKNPGGYCHIGPAHFDAAKAALVDPFAYEKKSQEELKETLPDIAYEVTQQNGTERPYENPYWDFYEEGLYVDITTGEPLFSSADKFESCGWPSFSRPVDPHVLNSHKDYTHGMIREEVRSRVGDAHLGHVFPDGPKEAGGLRYCINSAALRFIPKDKLEEEGYGKYLSLFEG